MVGGREACYRNFSEDLAFELELDPLKFFMCSRRCPGHSRREFIQIDRQQLLHGRGLNTHYMVSAITPFLVFKVSPLLRLWHLLSAPSTTPW